MQKLCWVWVLLLFVVGCGKKDSEQAVFLVPQKIVRLEANVVGFPVKGDILWGKWDVLGGKYNITFQLKEEEKTRSVHFGFGEGPGYLPGYPDSIYVTKDIIACWFSSLRKVILFDINGNYKDDVVLQETFASKQMPEYFFVHKKHFYFINLGENLFVKVDKDGTVVKRVVYPYFKKHPHATKFAPQVTACFFDEREEKIYVGYATLPFRIECYDLNLKKCGVISKKCDYKYKTVRINLNKKFSSGNDGDIVINSLSGDENYLYIQTFRRDDLKGSIPLMVYDKRKKFFLNTKLKFAKMLSPGFQFIQTVGKGQFWFIWVNKKESDKKISKCLGVKTEIAGDIKGGFYYYNIIAGWEKKNEGE